MCFWIQPKELPGGEEPVVRHEDRLDAHATPPGASRRSSVAKYVGQYSSPTASIISTLTIASKVPSTSR